MATKVEIWNMAIGLFRGRAVTAEGEASPSADACRAYYNTCYDRVLSLVPWSFATQWAPLPEHLVESLPGGYSLAFPQDRLKVWGARLPSTDAYQDEADAEVPFEVVTGNITRTRVVMTPHKDAEFQVTFRVDEGLLPGAVADLISLLLASKIAIALAGVEQGARLHREFLNQYEAAMPSVLAEDAGPRMLKRKESKYISARR